jgi:restriction endonuclease S subunit
VKFSLEKPDRFPGIFVVKKSDVRRRWDPFYFRPDLVALEARVREVTPHRLRDFVEQIVGGATPSRNDSEIHYTENPNGVPFIRVQNLSTTGTLDLHDYKRITRSTHEGLLARSRLYGGELLVKITGVGRMAVASVVPEKLEANINQHIVAIRTKNIKTSETLAAFLNLDIAERLASRRATGGTRPALDYPALLSIPIVYNERIPELLGSALNRYQQKLEKAEKLISQVDNVLLRELGVKPTSPRSDSMDHRIFKTSFYSVTGRRIDPLFHQGDIFHFIRSASCPLETLGASAVNFLTGFAAGRADQGDESSGIIQIRPTNISNERELIFRRNIFITPLDLELRSQDVLRSEEVLFNNTNSQEQVGKTAFFDLRGNYFCSNHITRIGVNRDRINPLYLYYVLNLYQRQRVFYKLCTNWNNQSGVSNDVLKRLPIPVPRVDVQTRISERLEAIRREARSLKQDAKRELEQAKEFIEMRILSGTTSP